MSAAGPDVEALVAGVCGLVLLAATAGGLAVRIAMEIDREPSPYSVCEFCGKVIDGTNNVCAAEGRAEGSSR